MQSTGGSISFSFGRGGLSWNFADAKAPIVMLSYRDDSQIKEGSYRIRDPVKSTAVTPEAVLLIRPLLQPSQGEFNNIQDQRSNKKAMPVKSGCLCKMLSYFCFPYSCYF
jgi:hypothetical protein